jgi:hypothetical protein
MDCDFATPEEAARGDIPARFARAIAVSEEYRLGAGGFRDRLRNLRRRGGTGKIRRPNEPRL